MNTKRITKTTEKYNIEAIRTEFSDEELVEALNKLQSYEDSGSLQEVKSATNLVRCLDNPEAILEAIDRIGLSCKDCGDDHCRQCDESSDLGILALQKRLAKAPIKTRQPYQCDCGGESDYFISYRCPDCNNELKYKQTYCDCGKHIHWETQS